MAKMTHALDTDAQRNARAREKVKKGIRNGTLEDVLLRAAIEKEKLLNYFQCNKEDRWGVLLEARSLLSVRAFMSSIHNSNYEVATFSAKRSLCQIFAIRTKRPYVLCSPNFIY
jgi:hypothetical protein